MSTPYDNAYFPPAPALRVSLARPDESPQVGPLIAIVDTGADGTLVPTHHLDTLAPSTGHQMQLHPLFGPARSVSVYLVDLIVEGHRLPAVNVVDWDGSDEIVLGRNVLNRLILLLDGPRGLTDLLDQRPSLRRR